MFSKMNLLREQGKESQIEEEGNESDFGKENLDC